MRALLVPSLLVCLCLALGMTVAEASTTAQVPVGWSWDQVAFRTTDLGETQVRVDGAGQQPGQPGEPGLPARLVRVVAPDGHGVASVSLGSVATSSRSLEAPLAPVLEDRPTEGGGPVRVEPDPRAYEALSFPAERVRFVGISLRRGVAYANFVVYPLALENEGRDLTLLESGVLQVTFAPDATVPLPLKTLRSANGQGARSEGGSAGEIGAGPSFVRPLAGRVGAVADRPSDASAPVDYVVLTTAGLENAILPFVEWKNQTGTATTVRTLEWVLDNYPDGVDTQERIRHFLTDAYRYWGTQWLLIVGGPEEIPIRTAKSYSWQAPTGVDIITDLYYACLDGTWNKDGDALFGEPRRASGPPNPIGDAVDFDAEIYVGRVPASTVEQVTEWMNDKYFRYARTPITDGYLDKTLFLGEALFAPSWTRAGLPGCGRIGDRCDAGCSSCITRDGAADCVEAVDILDASPIDRTHVELYEYYEYWRAHGRPNCLPETQAAVIEQIDAGIGIIHHVGHGDKDRMSVGTIGGTDGNGRYLVSNARAMANGDKVSVVYAINCNSAAIDYDCLGEVMLFAPNGGAVSYIGSSNLDFPNAAILYQNEFYERLFQEGVPTIGEAFYGCVSELMAPQGELEGYLRFVAYSLIILGEPQLGLWLNTPSEMVVNAPTTYTLGQSTLPVDVTRGGSALPGAIVCAYKATDVVAAGTTDAAGHVDLTFQPTFAGNFMITVTHPQTIPHREPANRAVTAPPAAPAVSVTGLSIVDSEGSESHGNDNSRFEEGETIRLGAILRNSGGVAANGLTLNLTIGPPELAPYIEVIDATHEGVNVPANTQALQVAGAFSIRRTNEFVPANLYQNGDRIPLVATVEVVGGSSPTSFRVPLPAYRPVFELERGAIIESSGNGNGIPENGETILWTPLIRNLGVGTTSPFHVTLTALAGATVEDGDAVLEAGELDDLVSVDAPFRFTVGNALDLLLQIQVISELATLGEALYVRFDRNLEFVPPTPALFSTETPPVATQDAIVLAWSGSASVDVQGYVLERSLDRETNFSPIHQGLLRTMNYYRDEGLPGLTRYYYRVAGVDSSGNRGAYSNTASATTAPGVMPGWPFSVRGDMNLGCPTIENIDGTGSYEMFLTADNVYGMNVDGTEIIDGDGLGSSSGVWSPLGGSFWSKTAIGDLDGDGDVEIVATSRYEQAPASGTGRIFVWNGDGSVAWQKLVGTSNILIASPVIANIDSDAQMEVVAVNRGVLYAWNHDGTPVIGGNADGRLANVGGGATAIGPFTFGSPAAADLDGNGDDEIILGLETDLGSKESHLVVVDGDGVVLATAVLEVPASGEQSCNASPSLADVDDGGGGDLEIFYTTRNRLWSFNYQPGQGLVRPPDWPAGGYVSIPKLPPTNWTESTPAIGDVNGDGELDVVVGVGQGQVLAVNGRTGGILANFPHTLDDPVRKIGSAILVNLDSDIAAEILIGNDGGTLYAINADGTAVPGFPYLMGGRLQQGLNCWDVDRDGHPNILVQADLLPQVTALDMSNVDFPDVLEDAMARFPWCSFRHDARNTGTLTKAVITPVLPLEVAVEGRVGSAVLQWNVAAEPQTFEVQRQDLSGEWIVRARGGAASFRQPEGGYAYEDAAEPGSYLYRVLGYDAGQAVMYESPASEVTVLPFQLRLVSVAPNPFKPRTAIRYETPGGALGVDVVDLGGRLVRRLAQGPVDAGSHELVWDGRDDAGHDVGSGVYLVRLSSGAQSFSRKIVLLR